MINTFNLEQNLLTFPSERDVLTGGERGVGAVEDGWLDGRVFTCPRVSVCVCSRPPRQAAQTPRVHGTGDTVDSCHQGPRGSTLPQTVEVLVNSRKETAGVTDPEDVCRAAGLVHAVGKMLLGRAELGWYPEGSQHCRDHVLWGFPHQGDFNSLFKKFLLQLTQ